MTLPNFYHEDPNHQIPNVFLSDEAYAEAMKAMVIVCADTILINPEKRTVFLTQRAVKPIKDWWLIGGRVKAGEGALEAMQRAFKRETGLDVELGRFQFVSMNRYHWKDREQVPQETGSDNFSYTFFLTPTDKELDTIGRSLEKTEYVKDAGLKEFDRNQLVKIGVHQVIIDLYDTIFPNLNSH